jgi:ABC-type transporter Mla subunit MlaD
MSTKANYFKIGLFVIAAVATIIAAVVVLAAWKTGDIKLETYMDESVQGLDIGSPVTYRGVQMGRVDKITFVANEYEATAGSQYGRYVMVVLLVNGRQMLGDDFQNNTGDRIKKLVDKGLRIRLTTNPLTGISHLEADYPSDPIPALKPTAWVPKEHYIPSDRSILTTFTQSAEKAFKALSKIDIAELAQQLHKETTELMHSLNEAIQDANIPALSEAALQRLSQVEEINRQLKALLGAPDGKETAPVPKVLARLNIALERLNETLERIDRLIISQRPDIEKIADNVREFSMNLRELTEALQKNPSGVFYKPPKSEVVE